MRTLALLALAGCSLVVDPTPPQDALVVGPVTDGVVIDAACPAEVCNGLDDDCDDLVDEALTQPCYPFDDGEPGVGACVAGESTCDDGTYGLCEGAVGPEPEIPEDGIDQDCDGLVDE